jgi:hypothetical protein
MRAHRVFKKSQIKQRLRLDRAHEIQGLWFDLALGRPPEPPSSPVSLITLARVAGFHTFTNLHDPYTKMKLG